VPKVVTPKPPTFAVEVVDNCKPEQAAFRPTEPLSLIQWERRVPGLVFFPGYLDAQILERRISGSGTSHS
jgi:hypothetical protein